MLRLGLGGLILTLLGSPTLLWAQPPSMGRGAGPGSSPDKTLFGKLFGKKEPPPTITPKISPREQAAQTILQEQQALLEHLAVCTRLREIAEETGNESVNRKADELEEMAYEIYNKRIAHLPGARDASKIPDETLDRQLGRGVSTDPLESDGKKAKGKNAKASVKREEKP
jgi:hypothetical protein